MKKIKELFFLYLCIMLNKKYIAFIFLTIFLFTNVGWSINVHYCQGDSISNLSYLHDTKHQCMMEEEVEIMPCCQEPIKQENLHKGHQKADDCCKNEVIKSSVTDQTINKIFPLQFEAIFVDTTWTEIQANTFHFATLKQDFLDYYIESNAPPLYRLYCRLIFYA